MRTLINSPMYNINVTAFSRKGEGWSMDPKPSGMRVWWRDFQISVSNVHQ